ncbi:class I SAM-dependent methyltransferase [Castellaniella sp. GW247-6E4]|uniref:class I SAM-dependent methyltransferase n=1 Tax=Castellaniella sp. GW247-6E4 TaxID=3140380 RepID=UPI00331587CF
MSPDIKSKLIFDERTLSTEQIIESGGADLLGFNEVLQFLASPDSGLTLGYDDRSRLLTDEAGNSYPRRGELPLLIPTRLIQFYSDRLDIPYSAVSDSFLQYYFLSTVKQSGELAGINSATENIHYQRHLYRMKDLLSSARGRVLDVGCDDPMIGAALLDDSASYVGLDPFCKRPSPFRLIGFGENLPFRNATFDCVVFNTSLDHIFDWRKAIDEARRVLVPKGLLFICTLIWTDRADLVNDAVHFHHFRDYEIMGQLSSWEVASIKRYDYKGADHRHGLYLSVSK